MPTERELKYSLIDDDIPTEGELRAAYEPHGIAVAGMQVVTHTDRYYDDARLSLSRAGVALRRRTGDGEAKATLKTRGTSEGGYHSREEIELPFEAQGWPPPIRERIEAITDPASLHPVLSIETERVKVPLEDGSGTMLAELSFDRVAARLPGSERTVHFDELELEADPAWSGDADALRELVEPLEPLLTLTASSSTKLERARALLMAF